VYHIGVLRALNDYLLDRSVNDFDVYVGTSAGAVIASAVAAGIRTKDLMRAVSGTAGEASLRRSDVFQPNYREVREKLLGLPGMSASAVWHYLRHLRDMDLLDFVMLFQDALPSGIFDSAASARYIKRVFALNGVHDHFDSIGKDLTLVATDLDTAERVLFGKHHHSRVPVSNAAAASAAVPVLYSPMRIEGKDYIDGGLRGTASVDIAIEHGADLVICVNPLVPFDNTARTARNIPMLGQDARRVREKGLSAIINQVTRTALHSGLQYHLKQVRRAHPEVDIVLIEPKRTDARMFFNNPMRFSSRMHIARHGYESAVVELEEQYEQHKTVLARHGIAARRSLVREQLRRIRRAEYDPQVVSKILESRTAGALNVGERHPRWDRLASTLELLDREVAYRLTA